MTTLDSPEGQTIDGTAADCTAFDETVVFLSHFRGLQEPRQQDLVDSPLPEILLLCQLAVLAGAEKVTDIALFGARKQELLRRFHPLARVRPRMTRSVPFWRRWTTSNSSVALLPGAQS